MKFTTSPILLQAGSRVPCSRWLKGAVAQLVLGGLTMAIALSQTTSTPINPISYFQVQEGSSAVSWSQTGTSVDSSGNSTITFQDGNGGTSTMIWSNTGSLSSWAINLVSSTQVYTDATAQGQAGAFLVTGGAVGTNQVLSINGHPYVYSGSLLQPTQINPRSYAPGVDLSLYNFSYAGVTCQCVSGGIDYLGRTINTFSGTAGVFTATRFSGLQIYGASGIYIHYYVDPTGNTYTYQADSTVPNQLSQINGYNLTANGNNLSLPACPIQNFTSAGTLYTWTSVFWSTFLLHFGEGNPVLESVFNGSGIFASYSAPNGNLASLQAPHETINPTPNSYAYTVLGSNQITAINGVPYVAQSGPAPYSYLIPQGPVSGFIYAGNTYQFTGYSQASDGNWTAQYSAGGTTPATASLEYSPSNDAFVKMTINAPAGGTATYVNGASVGQPGAYVWSNTSTAANLLSGINNSTYTPSGNSDLPSTATTTNGVFQIEGNFMSLGSWSNNSSQAGLTLSYYDSQTTTPANIEFTASRPLTAWLWDAATSDGTAVTPVMQLDQNSRLLLYAPDAVTAAGAAGPTPSVILDPSTTNPSDFTGVVRFEGPVRISPQGDLSMGTFIQDGFPAQPTQ